MFTLPALLFTSLTGEAADAAADAAAEVAENVSNTKDQLLSSLGLELGSLAISNIVAALVILIVCLIATKVICTAVGKLLRRSKLDKTLHAFIQSAVRALLYILTAIIVVGSLGFNVASLVAVLSVAGLAVSLAMQNSLSNLAGGIMILVTKPFLVGDFIEAGGQTGTVQEIGMAYTKLSTLDNKRISIPNSAISSANIVNYSTEGKRRVDLTFSVAYENDVENVKNALHKTISRCDKVLTEGADAPFVRLSEYGESTITYTVRVWCKNADYWDVYFFLLEEAGKSFKEAGVQLSYKRIVVEQAK
jgi:small conductance mechanosensitive channel